MIHAPCCNETIVIVVIARSFTVLTILVWISTAVAANEVKQVSINGVEIAYLDAGKGDPVVFVHGGLQDYRFWEELLPRFAQSFRVIAYSRRNHFPNAVSADDTPDGAGDIHGEDLAALVGALRLQRVHVVAHSSGAVTALFFAIKHPELVRTLALNEPPATGLLASAPDGAAVLREFGAGLGPAREAFRTGDLDRGVRLFVDGVGAPERSTAVPSPTNAWRLITHLHMWPTLYPHALGLRSGAIRQCG